MLQARLKVIGGKHDGHMIPLSARKFLIGREQDCQLRTTSELVSRHHCVFTADDYALRLRDLGSTNGTFVNDERIRGEVMLKAGDEVRVGKLAFEVDLQMIERAEVKDAPVREVPDVLAPAEPEPESDAGSDTAYEMPVHSGYQESDTSIVSSAGDTTIIPAYNPAATPPQGPPPQQVPGYYPQPYYDPYQQQVPQGYAPPPQGGYPPPGGYPPQGYPYQQPGYYPQQYGAPYPPMPGYYPPQGQYPYPPQAAPPDEAATATESGEMPLRLPDPETTGAKESTVPKADPAAAPQTAPSADTPSQRAADIIKDRMKRRFQS